VEGSAAVARGFLPRPVLRERAGVRVMSSVERLQTDEITLILTFSRSAGRRDKRGAL
jgi:hypothetical protein